MRQQRFGSAACRDAAIGLAPVNPRRTVATAPRPPMVGADRRRLQRRWPLGASCPVGGTGAAAGPAAGLAPPGSDCRMLRHEGLPLGSGRRRTPRTRTYECNRACAASGFGGSPRRTVGLPLAALGSSWMHAGPGTPGAEGMVTARVGVLPWWVRAVSSRKASRVVALRLGGRLRRQSVFRCPWQGMQPQLGLFAQASLGGRAPAL